MFSPTYPRKPRPRRSRRRPAQPAPAPPAPPAPGLLVVAVLHQAIDTELVVVFDAAITWDGVTVPGAFKAFTHDGFLDGCIEVLDVGADWIRVGFNAGVNPGAAWEIDAAMEGITPAVSWPQSGVVV